MKKKWWMTAGVLLVCVGLVCGGVGLKKYLDGKHAGNDYDKLKEQVAVEEPPIQEETPAEETIEKEPVNIPVDFEKLQKKCPDIYAWICIPGTGIDYPVVQREGDNSYYLDHTIEGKKKAEGAIFTEDYNRKDFEDHHTVIYGHNMRNGSMFRQLHKFADRKFFKENEEVLIYQPEKIFHYQIFAAYVYDDRHLMLSFDCNDKEVYEDYLDSIFEQRGMSVNVNDDVEVTADDRILTLSTCNGNDDERYLVQAVLVSIEE